MRCGDFADPGFTGRAQNIPSTSTDSGQRASGKALTLTRAECKFFSARIILWHFVLRFSGYKRPERYGNFSPIVKLPLVSCFSTLVILTVLCAP